jgi:hypothetical protein
MQQLQQRRQQEEDLRSKVATHFHITDETERELLRTSLSIRGRLMRRLKHNTVQVQFEDDLGGFEIEARMLSPSEQNEIAGLLINLISVSGRLDVQQKRQDAQGINGLKKQSEALLDKIYRLAADICVDPLLDFEYWKAGKDYNIDVPIQVIAESYRASQRLSANIQKFRGE